MDLRIALFVSFILSSVVGKHILSNKCQDPSRWCRDTRTAALCGVTAFCDAEKERSGSENSVASAINVTVYYESLCPDSKHFFFQQLIVAFDKLYPAGVFNLKLVPYGNAKEFRVDNKWLYSCQHGPKECFGNLIETCAIYHINDITKSFPFIYCLEVYGPNLDNVDKCAKSAGIDFGPIKTCIDGPEGNKLEHMMAVETGALNPPHTFIPWFTVNGKHTDEIQNEIFTNMVKYLCKIYKGEKPKACFE